MTMKVFCVKIRCRKRKAAPKEMGPGKGKKMFTVIRSNYFYLESLRNAALGHKEEWGFGFVYSDKNEHERNAVRKDVSL